MNRIFVFLVFEMFCCCFCFLLIYMRLIKLFKSVKNIKQNVLIFKKINWGESYYFELLKKRKKQ